MDFPLWDILVGFGEMYMLLNALEGNVSKRFGDINSIFGFKSKTELVEIIDEMNATAEVEVFKSGF